MTVPGAVRLSELRLEGVGVREGGAWAVRDVSISVRPGELYTLLGPPGSGKTTLLRAIAGLIAPDAGRVVIDDAPVDGVPPSRRNLGMVFQGHALWPHLSVFEHVAFGLRERHIRGDELRRRVGAALGQVGLAGHEERRPGELSPGQAPRVALARALATQPRLLLLDEPLSGLDGADRADMRADLARLQRELAITAICATRDQADALALSTRVAVLAGGRLLQEGKPEDVYWRPRDRFVAEFVGPANLVPVQVVELRETGVVVETQGRTRLPVASGGRVWDLGARGVLCLRPEALRIEEGERSRGGIPGTISGYVFEGGRQLYDVAIPGGRLRVETLTSAVEGRGFQHGDRVKIEVSPETSVLLPDDPSPADILAPPASKRPNAAPPRPARIDRRQETKPNTPTAR